MLVPGAGGGRKNGLLGGRPPDEFRRLMREIANTPEAIEYLRACYRGEHGPQAAASARDYVTERGYGKEPSVTKLEGGAEPLVVVFREE